MARGFEGPPTREEIPILRGQIFSESEIRKAIIETTDAVLESYKDVPVAFIQVNQGAKFFGRGLKRAAAARNRNFWPEVYPISVMRTNTDSSFRTPVIASGLPEWLDLSELAVGVIEDIVDEGKTVEEAIVPHLIDHGAEIEAIDIWAMLQRVQDPEVDFPVRLYAARKFNSNGFVYGSGIDDNRLAEYERYRHDAGRGEKGIWENDPIAA